ncbi:MAG: methyltransferase domain-containing protein [Chloroflexi bacterium]|nr:methyltransferase domain-containing protein [Chloroflexota bacterium]
MDWHARFSQQAGWTRSLRDYIFDEIDLRRAGRILEVGCGTGALLAELPAQAAVHGLDLEPARLAEARLHAPRALLTNGDAFCLPFPAQTFDITFCHFLLLWIEYPPDVLCEMRRVTRPGGFVLALAEPDYSRRVDLPKELAVLGRWQAESLRRQGADPDLGGRLASLFAEAGIKVIETGSLRGSPGSSTGHGVGTHPPTPEERELEWAVLEADLAGFVPARKLQRMKKMDEEAWQRGERVLHVPTYYAWGRV